ncbi:acyl carrier protein [Anderseniella sp. Alg231-50]|uniref:acyl carrier protein n=1 Tax=Anderseniella sp. Alg231-50 TaxID=1922226 RepID=UPI000D55FEF6
MKDDVQTICLAIIRDTLKDSLQAGLTDEELLQTEVQSLRLDSLAKMEMILNIEDTLHIMMDEVEISNAACLQDIVNLVDHRSTEKV